MICATNLSVLLKAIKNTGTGISILRIKIAHNGIIELVFEKSTSHVRNHLKNKELKVTKEKNNIQSFSIEKDKTYSYLMNETKDSLIFTKVGFRGPLGDIGSPVYLW